MQLCALPDGFVYLDDPRMVVTLKYASADNFMGRPAKGYCKDNCCIVTKEAADALKKVQDELDVLNKNYHLHILDAYRPQQAVNDFKQWSQNNDATMKQRHYPNFKKDELFEKGYIAEKSGHSRGSTVDLTICVKNTADYQDLEMGTIFDFFGEESHTESTLVNKEAQKNRKFLKQLMERHDFENFFEEWWHYTLINEPFKKELDSSYFNFPIE